MGQLKNFMIEAQEAGADVDAAFANFEAGMLWDQAIAEAIPPKSTCRLDLPSISVCDAMRIGDVLAEAQAGIDQAFAEVRTLLQQRDLVEHWNDEDAAFDRGFEPLAEAYHQLQRACQVLAGDKKELSTESLTSYVFQQQ